ncbi:MAG: hypothetical protein EHM70_00315 [Chloroflexota bacterium]|nr:MAG: hypothetical protein EHM70_00315 [Chloroflexota bacterium]
MEGITHSKFTRQLRVEPKKFAIWLTLIIFFLASTSAIPPIAYGSSPSLHQSALTPGLEVVGHLGGEAGEVEVAGRYAYMAQAAELAIIDIADPADLRRVGYVLLPGKITGLAVEGETALAGWEQCEVWTNTCAGGLSIVDVSRPDSPVEIGSYDLPSSASGLTINGEYAYVLWIIREGLLSSWGGMKVLDISNPALPVEMVSINLWNGPLNVVVAGDYAYLVGDRFLRTFDLSQPFNPIQINEVEHFGEDIAVSGSYAYILGGGLWTVSLADPAQPEIVGVVEVDGDPHDIDIQGRYAYVSETGFFSNGNFYYGGMHIIDISNPFTPTEVAALPLPYGSRGIAVQGTFAFVSEVYNGLSAVDISTPSAPYVVDAYLAPGEVYDVIVSGQHVFSTSDRFFPGASGLWVIDQSDRSNQYGEGFLEAFNSRALDIESDYVYVLNSLYGKFQFDNFVRMVDVSDPRNPIQTSIYALPTDQGAYNIAVRNQFIYVTQPPRLTVIDARDPYQLSLANIITPTEGIMWMDIAGPYAYVSDGGLRILDNTDPFQIRETGRYTLTSGSGRMTVWENYAYVLGGGYLHIIDITDPRHPQESGSVKAPWFVVDLGASGGYVYLAAFTDGLRIIDARVPSNAYETNPFYGAGRATGVTVQDESIYLGNLWGGLYILGRSHMCEIIYLPVVNRVK